MLRCSCSTAILLAVLGCGPRTSTPEHTVPTILPDDPSPPLVPVEPAKPTPPKPVEPMSPAVKVDLKAEKEAEAYAIKVGGTPLRNVSHVGERNALITISFLGTDEKPADVKAVELKKFAGAARLIRLSFLGAKNVDAALEGIAALPMLKSVSMEGSDLTDAGLAAIAALPELNELDLTRVKGITAKGWKALARAAKLETLWLSNTIIEDAAFKELGGLAGLKTLKIDGTNLTLENTGATFAQFKQLVELDAGGSPVNDEGLLALCAARGLEKLTLRAATITDAGFQPVAQLLKLKELNLAEIPGLTGTGFADIAELSGLAVVTLSDSGITDKGMKSIARLFELKHLDLDRTKITDDGIKQLAGKRALEKLSVQETKVGDSGLLAVVAEAKSLKKVEVRKSKVSKGIGDEVRKVNPDVAIDFEG